MSHVCPDLSILRSAVLGDKSYNLGAIVARRLHLNKFNGDFFGGIYATRAANYLGIAPREGDMIIPPIYLDSEAMVNHQFLGRNEQFLQINFPFYYYSATYVQLLPRSYNLYNLTEHS